MNEWDILIIITKHFHLEELVLIMNRPITEIMFTYVKQQSINNLKEITGEQWWPDALWNFYSCSDKNPWFGVQKLVYMTVINMLRK